MKKLCPYHRYDVMHITQWLNELSSYGWELSSWGTLFCKFQEYDGSRYQYQLDMDNRGDGANKERRKELEALGWEYADTISGTRLHIYRSLDWKRYHLFKMLWGTGYFRIIRRVDTNRA